MMRVLKKQEHVMFAVCKNQPAGTELELKHNLAGEDAGATK